jgi:F-type H+-transporting ATPase subunit gamma
MANLKQLRRRITGIKGTQQLTRAMKLVAAAKLRRAQEAVEALRPYSENLLQVIRNVADTTDEASHPLLQDREMKNIRVLMLTSDRGLCGAFNSNINKGCEQYFKTRGPTYESMELLVVGRKGNEYMTHRELPIHKYFDGVMDGGVTYRTAATIGDEISDAFISGETDGLFLVYNEFKSAMFQEVVWKQLLPMDENEESTEESELTAQGGDFEHVFEPGKEAILDRLLPLHVNITIYRALLESLASEMGARMTAMDSATNNAEDLIERLTLQYNKARQEAITTELMDIVGGAEALKG